MTGKTQNRWLRLVVVCSVLCVGACSSTSFVYNRLDTLLPWYLDDYADLNREQEKYLDDLLEPFLQWHRSQELPRYVVLIDDLQTTLDEPVSADDLALVVDNFRLAWLRIEGEGLDWMLALGDTLSEEQIAQFIASLRDQNEEYAEKYLTRSDEQYYEDSYENLRDNATDYVGRLSKPQRRALEAASEKLQRSDSQWLAEQRQWIDQLETLLTRQPGWQERVRAAVAARPDNAPQAYRERIAHNTGVIQSAVAGLLNSLNEKQAAYLSRKLTALRNDLKALSAG